LGIIILYIVFIYQAEYLSSPRLNMKDIMIKPFIPSFISKV
jgi:hypothetical protein